MADMKSKKYSNPMPKDGHDDIYYEAAPIDTGDGHRNIDNRNKNFEKQAEPTGMLDNSTDTKDNKTLGSGGMHAQPYNA